MPNLLDVVKTEFDDQHVYRLLHYFSVVYWRQYAEQHQYDILLR